MNRGTLALISWVVTFSLSASALSPFLSRAVEGRHFETFEFWPLVVVGLAVVVSLWATIRWARGERTNEAADFAEHGSSRRRFLLAALAASSGVAATLASAIAPNRDWMSVTIKNIFAVNPPYKAEVSKDAWRGSRVESYRRLGRTEAMISDISLGSGASTGGRQTVDVTREAIERGINYFDTAPDYSETDSEHRFGEAMKGRRDQMFVATKFCLPSGHLGPGHSVEEYMAAVEGSLMRLQTDWIDLVHIHSCNTVERLMAENAHEAFDRLKEQGKVRFLGVSTHTPNLEEVANAAIDSDRFDVMMLAYHFGAWPHLADIIDRAAAKDIGIVAMKTLRGSKHHFLDWTPDERDSFTQASFKWVLSNPSVSGLVISLWESGQLDEFLYASGKTPRPRDLAILERYDALTSSESCRPHCGACLDQCSEGLAIHDILRHRMYFEGMGAQKEAMRLYGALEKNASACVGCAAPCATACPFGVDIAGQVRGAHDLLSLS
jgi:aryl-alcohol dehydrogenase-like predicted oxidoreductase